MRAPSFAGFAAAGLALGLALGTLVRAADDEDEIKPHPFCEAVKAAIGKEGKAFLAETKDGKVEVSYFSGDKVLVVTVDPATKKLAGEPKEPAKDSDTASDAKNVKDLVAKAKVDLATAIDKALQTERKIDVDLAQATVKEKALVWLVQLKKGGVESAWEVDGETGKVSQQKKAGGAMGGGE